MSISGLLCVARQKTVEVIRGISKKTFYTSFRFKSWCRCYFLPSYKCASLFCTLHTVTSPGIVYSHTWNDSFQHQFGLQCIAFVCKFNSPFIVNIRNQGITFWTNTLKSLNYLHYSKFITSPGLLLMKSLFSQKGLQLFVLIIFSAKIGHRFHVRTTRTSTLIPSKTLTSP